MTLIRRIRKSCRPISNLSLLSKLLERLVSKQLVAYLLENDLFPDLQSPYQSNHSTETAVLKVLSDILLALDSGKLALLSLLDLSAAFESVDHDTLLQRLQTSYGLGEDVLLCLPGSPLILLDVHSTSRLRHPGRYR